MANDERLRIDRRRFIHLGLGAAGAAGMLSTGVAGGASAAARTRGARRDGWLERDEARGSVRRAYRFLDSAMDAYQSGRTTRLIQSYADQQRLGSTAFTYDNALAIIAYLERGDDRDVRRARVLGDSLLYAQTHDPGYNDGRLRQAYYVGPFDIGFARSADYFVRPNGAVNLVGEPFFFVGSAVGDMAWAAIALAQLADRTDEERYLDGAVRLGRWIANTTFDTRGPGGYNFGVDGGNNKLLFKSTEHNIDVYGLFNNLLAPLTDDDEWKRLGRHARTFIEAMWNAGAGFFWTGTTPDGVTINRSPLPEDPQSWSYLALRRERFEGALDWAKTNLATTDSPRSRNASFSGNLAFSGVTFSDVSLRATEPSGQFDPPPDPDAVWFEGTAQMAAALLERDDGDKEGLAAFDEDRDLAGYYLENIRLAQERLGRGQTVGGKPTPERSGVVAASSVLNTGFGFSYFPNLHVGATSWYLIAAREGNPYRLRDD